MKAPDLDLILKKITERGFNEASLQYTRTRTEQVRFSRNIEDVHNDREESNISVFAARGKRTVSTNIKNFERVEESIQRLWEVAGKVPENPKFEGINPDKMHYGDLREIKLKDYDIQDMASALISSALDSGAERTAGAIYSRDNEVTVKTNYNQCTYKTGGLEVLIRSFKGDLSGQESRHYGRSYNLDSKELAKIGRDSTLPLAESEKVVEIQPGKHEVLMSPYVIGNIISYSSDFLSYYAVESNLSCFSDLLDKKVSDSGFTLVDDPLDPNGVGYRACDEEGTPTSRNTLIDKGILKTYMHSYSTGKRSGNKTTANAGIVTPVAWQMKILPGKKNLENMLSEMKDGLWINNTWYTRYQDYKNGVFSTVPRDGVFLVKNGEVQGTVKGIRISDSVPSILENISAISSEVKSVKWWEEIAASSMPSVVVKEVNISRAF